MATNYGPQTNNKKINTIEMRKYLSFLIKFVFNQFTQIYSKFVINVNYYIYVFTSLIYLFFAFQTTPISTKGIFLLRSQESLQEDSGSYVVLGIKPCQPISDKYLICCTLWPLPSFINNFPNYHFLYVNALRYTMKSSGFFFTFPYIQVTFYID